jgi:hypothetical protein
MTDSSESAAVDLPRVYLIRMMVFTILVAIIGAILYPQFETAFMANPGLNGLIVFVLLLGILYAFRMVWRLFREVNWVNHFRISEPGLDIEYTPRLLAPMAALLRDRQGTVLSPLSMRSLLDSLASRLDEARDISRYLIGLLIFLGLLGTFWGLLETVTSVGATIRSLDVSTAESATIFEELKAGLAAPLAGMGTSFSSSLFGLAGALVLGFLDLQASQAQNRFYNDLEDWLSSITDIAAGDGRWHAAVSAVDLSHIEKSIDHQPYARRGPGRPRVCRRERGRQRQRRIARAPGRRGRGAGAADARGAEDRAPVGPCPVGAAVGDPPHAAHAAGGDPPAAPVRVPPSAHPRRRRTPDGCVPSSARPGDRRSRVCHGDCRAEAGRPKPRTTGPASSMPWPSFCWSSPSSCRCS